MPSSILNNIFDDLETRSFFLFYLTCKYRFRFSGRSAIEKYQLKKTRKAIKYAVANSKFFMSYYSGCNLQDISSLPILNKKIMMNNLSDYNTVGLTGKEIIDFCLEVERTRDFSRRLKGLNIGMSSGTSGNKGVEIVTPREENYMKAALFARYDFPKNEKINLAFILRITTPAFSLNIFGHKLTYVSQLNPVEQVREQLSKIQPNVLSSPPSMLRIIAKEIETGRLAINPKRVISYAEVLYPDVKEYLTSVFKCPVHEIYKCTEGPIAISCKQGSLHINEDLVLVETLNYDGSQTPAGSPCQRMVVTDLHKRSQPIIRYELNDIITISPEKCSCGSSFRVIENLQGRADDIFWSKNRITGEWQYIFPDYISRAVISSSEDIDEYQVFQSSPSGVLVRILLKESVPEESFNKIPVRENIENVFETYKCLKPDVKIEFGKPHFNINSNKLIRIQRTFNKEKYDTEQEN
jgi:putative adenylate-forming enzyme